MRLKVLLFILVVLTNIASYLVGWREKVAHKRNLAVLWVQVGYDAAWAGKNRAVLVNDVFNLYDDTAR